MGGSIDPIGYDVAELRELARVRGDRYVADGFLWTELPESRPTADGTAEYDRPVAWTGSLEERQKPYLRRLPEGEEADRTVRQWIRELVERAGAEGTVEALTYYESIGWITEAVRYELEGYLLAVGYRAGGSIEDLDRADHVTSLARTARLARLVGPDSGPDDGKAEEEGSRPPPERNADGTDENGGDDGGDGDGDTGFRFGPRSE